MLKPSLCENLIFFNVILFPVGLLSNRQDFTWGWGRYIWGSELKFYNFKMASWICHINVNMPFGRETVSCLNGVQLFDANQIYYTGTIFSLKKLTCIFESPFINFAPSIIVIYENLSWSGVWISPIRYFLIFSNSCLMLMSSPFSICK